MSLADFLTACFVICCFAQFFLCYYLLFDNWPPPSKFGPSCHQKCPSTLFQKQFIMSLADFLTADLLLCPLWNTLLWRVFCQDIINRYPSNLVSAAVKNVPQHCFKSSLLCVCLTLTAQFVIVPTLKNFVIACFLSRYYCLGWNMKFEFRVYSFYSGIKTTYYWRLTWVVSQYFMKFD